MNPNIHFWLEVAVSDQHHPLSATAQLPYSISTLKPVR